MATIVLTKKETQIRNILRSTYSYMTVGLLITAIVAFISTPMKITRGAMLIAIFAEIGLVFYLSAKIMSIPASRAAMLFWVYSALNGFVISVVMKAYTNESVFQAFLTAAGAFGGMSLYALVTKKDLSGLGKYLMMGLWGVIIASLLSMFFPSNGFSPVISLIALVLFMGLTAYDTQMIRNWGNEYGDTIPDEDYKRLSIIGALKLYLDFINIFLILLRFMGVSRRG